ncbi:unnamed protein product [Pneumocystis jirovecii]|uniref:Uncharacterized protein n=1 Tax=Pneumocystis jirovecii TaxID=42068 RepID=L0P9X8_PNEJI|nr:unnamed protein product [Pneumocystis jirovecii]
MREIDTQTQEKNCQISKDLNTYTNNILIFKNNVKHIEAPVLAIYPITIILGTLYKLNNKTRESYFSHRWFWTTIVFLYHLSRIGHKNILKACLRWLLVTLWWFFITQWFFGSSIMDRIFIWTGGSCKFYDLKLSKIYENSVHSSMKCKLAGGKWTGGYDFSGHAFLLTHASLFLWSELLLALNFNPKCAKQSQTIIIIILLFLWWYMLLMTACYFHTLMEKITGLIIGYFTWASIYFFGAKNPIGKKVLGLLN